jgi:hypothetical protein
MKTARALAVVLVCCMCSSATADAAQTVKLNVAFAPDRAGARTTIELALQIGGPNGTAPAPLRSLGLQLPANMGIATTTLGQENCDPAKLIASGLSGCSANARVGHGTATAVVPLGSQSILETASLNALMGPPAEDREEILFYVQAARPVFAQLVLPSVVEEARPPYGEELATAVPLVQAWPEGPDLALTRFDSTIGPLGLTYHRHAYGHTIAFHPRGIRLPRSCPAGGFPFAAVASFLDGTQTTGLYRVPCPPR